MTACIWIGPDGCKIWSSRAISYWQFIVLLSQVLLYPILYIYVSVYVFGKIQMNVLKQNKLLNKKQNCVKRYVRNEIRYNYNAKLRKDS